MGIRLRGAVDRHIQAADWPQWLGPKRDGVSKESVEPWTEAPKVLWRQPVGPGYSVPIVAEGRVFVHEQVRGKDEEQLIAYDAVTGKQLWRDTTPRTPYKSILNTRPQGTPAHSLARRSPNAVFTCATTRKSFAWSMVGNVVRRGKEV